MRSNDRSDVASAPWQRLTRGSYDAVAHAYAQQVGPLADADGEMAAVFAELVETARGGSLREPVVGDIGCGPGWWTRRMADEGARVIGVDASPVMTGVAVAGLGGDVVPSGSAGFLAGSATALPLAAAALDGVALWYLLHHLSEPDVRVAIREARRVCRDGGVMLVGGHVGEGERVKREGYGLPMEVLVAKRSPAWWERAVSEAGFEVVRHEVSGDEGHHVLWASAVR